MEAVLLVEGVGGWRSFDEIEESITLDELLLLHQVLGRTKHNDYRMLASFQGVDIGEYDGDDDEENDLPEELLAADREYQKKKKEYLEANGEPSAVIAELNEIAPGGFGYKRK